MSVVLQSSILASGLGSPPLPAVEYAAGEEEAAVAARKRTMQWFAFDSHKHYTWALVQDERGKALQGLVWNMNQPD